MISFLRRLFHRIFRRRLRLEDMNFDPKYNIRSKDTYPYPELLIKSIQENGPKGPIQVRKNDVQLDHQGS